MSALRRCSAILIPLLALARRIAVAGRQGETVEKLLGGQTLDAS